jgi:succinoglycan biosynthesis protein ExoM
MNQAAATRIDICVCTFRRPQLAETLRSLAQLEVPDGYVTSILVADNDDEPSARPIVVQLADELDLHVRYIHCPARNISLARNVCLDVSSAEFIAFIDDDETAKPDWIARLIDAAEQEGAEVVLGPVRARYGPDTPVWMRKGDFHSTFPVWVRGSIRTGYTCNALMRRSAASLAGIRFSLARGQTGGEDTEFFSAVNRRGGRIAFAPQAWVEEPVPPGRATFGWLARRRFRVGQTHGRLLGERRGSIGTSLQIGLAVAKVAYCLAGAALAAFQPVRRNRNLLRGIMHAGVVGGLTGISEQRHYGLANPEAT